MSRSMTIKWLKWIQNMFDKDSEQYKALQFAIDSLEVDELYQLEYEQPEFCADCISRKDALKHYESFEDDDMISVKFIKKNIEEQPGVYPKSK